MTVERHFLGWHRDAVSAAVACLTSGWQDGNLDLRDRLIVVPTRNAARRLREKLAEVAAENGAVTLPGRVVTPEYLVADRANHYPNVASPSEVIAVWTDLLSSIDLRDYAALFPDKIQGQNRDTSWSLSTAENLSNLRRTLSEAGLSLRETAEKLAESPEPERWADLARLEEAYLQKLEEIGRQDPEQVKLWTAQNPKVPENINALDVFAVPDPLPLAASALDGLAEKMPVNIYVHAPADFSETFDRWGRPLADYWSRHSIDIPAAENTIIVAADPEDQARKAADKLEKNAVQPDSVALGVPDDEVKPHAKHELTQRGMATFDPAGETLESHTVVQLIDRAAELAAEGTFAAFSNLVRHPDMLAYLREHVKNFDPARFLADLDAFQNEHVPRTFSDLRYLLSARHQSSAVVQNVAGTVEGLLENVPGTEPIAGLINMLREIYAVRHISSSTPEDRAFADAAEQISGVAAELTTPVFGEKLGLDAQTVVNLFRRQLCKKRVYPDRAGESVDLQGWLELQWDDSPYLLITGMNDGRVPETIVGDAFLPDGARTRLGVQNNAQRFARDAYMLSAILECRRENGAVTLISGKTTERSDPLKPSRLFFLCEDDELVARTRHLFAEISETAAPVSNQTRWQFTLPQPGTPQRLRVTDFASFLQCPFRFYLSRILEMEALDDAKIEMDSLDFGSLVHAVLDNVLGHEGLRTCVDISRLSAAVDNELDTTVAEWYGQNLSAPLAVQIESARQRLRAVVRKHAELVHDGWETIDTERRVRAEIDGVEVHGRVDRIDRHPDGRIRVLDYKTSEKGYKPEEVLWGKPRESALDGATLFDYAVVEVNNKQRQWLDLQLPLYAYILREEFPEGTPIECGYFNIPKAITATDVNVWQSNNDCSYIESAFDCARNAVADIKAGRFWPPARPPQYDDFEKLFLEEPQKAFDANTLASRTGK